MQQNTSIMREGQVTIPKEMRRALGLREGDFVAWILEEDHVHVQKGESVVARTAGILKSDIPSLSAEEERAAAEQAIADDVMERMRWPKEDDNAR